MVLYLIGNGGDGTFKVNETENLSGSDLDTWLDSLQTSIPSKVTVIYEACRSGSFLPLLTPLSGKERILIASASESQSAYFISGGDISFSKFFWGQVANGSNVRNAFLHGKGAIKYARRGQTPQMDDNGNGTGNEKADGLLARNYTIGAGIMLAGDDPIIGSVSDPLTLLGESSATLWAKDVTTTNTIGKVWAVITPPGYFSDPGSPVTDLPTVALNHVCGGRYEGTYSSFSTVGRYEIAIHAVDRDGNVSLPLETTVTTSASAPTTATGNATSVIFGMATLNGTVNPNGISTDYYFQYGRSGSYGLTTLTTDAGNGTDTVSVSEPITDLKPGTGYHFRIVGSSSAGSSYGSDQSFKTAYASVIFVNRNDDTCGGNSLCYTTIQAAIDGADTGVAIRIAGGTYEEPFELNETKSLTLSGRWNDGFTDQTGGATIIKTPSATKGSLTLRNVNIRP